MARFGRSGLLVSLAALSLLSVADARASEWEWIVAPYLWGSSVGVDVTANDDPVVSDDVSFADLLDKTEFAAMVHFEGASGKAGFFVDAIFLDLAAEQTTAGRPPLPGGTQTSTDLQMGLYEAAGFFRPGGKARGLDVFLGTRIIDTRIEVDVTIPPPIDDTTSADTDDTFVDAFAGARYRVPIGKRWDFIARADAGAGGTDLTWSAIGTFGVRFGESDHYSLRFGWRYMDIDMKANDVRGVTIESDLTLNGPIVGFAFKF